MDSPTGDIQTYLGKVVSINERRVLIESILGQARFRLCLSRSRIRSTTLCLETNVREQQQRFERLPTRNPFAQRIVAAAEHRQVRRRDDSTSTSTGATDERRVDRRRRRLRNFTFDRILCKRRADRRITRDVFSSPLLSSMCLSIRID